MTRTVLLGLASLSAGCLLGTACSMLPSPPRKKPVHFYRADARDLRSVRRVMVLPFDADAGTIAPLETIRQAVQQELGKIQRFELVPLPDGNGEDAVLYREIVRGRVSTEALVALGERYQIDGVLLGTVTTYRAYTPPHMGIRLRLVSAHTGQSVWVAEGQYDAADAATVSDLQHYAGSYLAAEASMHGWEINLISPTRFAGYVAHRLVATWRE